jgi:hypothetical protein
MKSTLAVVGALALAGTAASAQRVSGLNCTRVAEADRSPLCEDIVRVCTAAAAPTLAAVTAESFKTVQASCEASLAA